jgi:hypothetical protein
MHRWDSALSLRALPAANSTHIHGTHVPVEEPSTASLATDAPQQTTSLFDHLVGASEPRLTQQNPGQMTRGFSLVDVQTVWGISPLSWTWMPVPVIAEISAAPRII